MPDDSPFPALTVADAEKIVRDLERAWEEHRQWVLKFHALLVCRNRPPRGHLNPNSHLGNPFGRWYEHPGNKHLRNHPGFREAGQNYWNLMGVARQLVRQIADGEEIAVASFRAFQTRQECFRAGMQSLMDEARRLLRYTDPLTGIATRFAMLPKLEQERERMRRTGEPSAVGLADLDHFKKVNDTYGHAVGDQVLHDVARHLLGSIRRYDQVCRYGGEEFLLLLPGTPPARAKKVLDRLRRSLKRRRLDIGEGRKLSISISFGIATLDTGKPVFETLEHADRALYAAKAAGRNRVRVWVGDDTVESRGEVLTAEIDPAPPRPDARPRAPSPSRPKPRKRAPTAASRRHRPDSS